VEWVQAAAGERFAQLELHIRVGDVIVTLERKATTAQLGPTVGLTGGELLQCLQALIGTEDEIVADLLARRAELGISYITVSENDMEVLAPIVKRLKLAMRQDQLRKNLQALGESAREAALREKHLTYLSCAAITPRCSHTCRQTAGLTPNAYCLGR
jgi:hypothetical protein